MKKKIFLKIIIILVAILTIFLFNVNHVQASEISNVIQGADSFINAGLQDRNPTMDPNSTQAMSDLLFNILLVLAIIVVVIIGLVIALQFITGGISQKAKVKETLIPYVAGCIVIFGAFGIWRLVINILSQV